MVIVNKNHPAIGVEHCQRPGLFFGAIGFKNRKVYFTPLLWSNSWYWVAKKNEMFIAWNVYIYIYVQYVYTFVRYRMGEREWFDFLLDYLHKVFMYFVACLVLWSWDYLFVYSCFHWITDPFYLFHFILLPWHGGEMPRLQVSGLFATSLAPIETGARKESKQHSKPT